MLNRRVWIVLFALLGFGTGGVSLAQQCHIGADGKHYCGDVCALNADGTWTCYDRKRDDKDDDEKDKKDRKPIECHIGADGRQYCGEECALNADGTWTCR